jgi:uroporphyrinogen decarboxylase
MNSKQRMLTAMKLGKPDMVPVAPDMSNMIPARLTKKPWWDIYFYGNPPLHMAYLDAVKKFGFDGWDCGYVGLGANKNDKKEYKQEILHKTDEEILVRTIIKTPDGDLSTDVLYRKDMTPAIVTPMIKKIPGDFKIYIKHFFPDPSGADDTEFQKWKKAAGDLIVVSCGHIPYPGFAVMVDLWEGHLEAITYAYYDYPELFDEYIEIADNYAVQLTKRVIQTKPDYIFTGASGTITLQSPDLFRKFGLPTLKKITKLAKDAGLPSLVHSCGKEKDLVKMAVEETGLSAINPLEILPMGDCDLGELKRLYGKKICLMGNLHTTEVMLKGSVATVEQAAKKAIDDAGANGGFILSTGDQCGRDTPDENVYKLIEVARTYGKY